MTHHLLLTALVAASAKGKSSGSSGYLPLLFLAAIFVGLYFLVLRPRNKRMRAQQTAAKEIEIGSEVMSVGGIMGTVVDMTDTTFDVRVADGVVLTFIRRAVNPRPPGTGGTEVDDGGAADPWDLPPTDDDITDGDPEADDDAGGGPEGFGKGRA